MMSFMQNYVIFIVVHTNNYCSYIAPPTNKSNKKRTEMFLP